MAVVPGRKQKEADQYWVSFGTEDKYIKAGLRLEQVRVLVYRVITKSFQPLGVTPEQAIIMVEIHNSSVSMTPTRLGKIIRRDAAAVSRILGRMQKNGTINLIKDLEYKNLIRIELTPKGVEICEGIEKTIKTQHDVLFKVLNETEVESFIVMLEKINKVASDVLKNMKFKAD
ncbi:MULTISPECIES: MarR family winged helix-turn-helix transcriptional regulator [Dehalococcoides]|jgi:MarR family multiple antibiotic resistance transcriptional regulator|uniref:Transcriptional regulator, MarR family n=1 Tax=Dehalococcoides mccartyi (strain VS) TaxID=311424 RepID=D2BJI8_DEHMV|nr:MULTISPECIES: DNA-binding protein [Dehalococcoides]ACZ62488.1 transcriptional regulator, MarR family [Dehalococcoides mccartyi VS]AHB14181.1 MarR family transcriptional regulator [Dehalococcoides mccartyi GY50]AII58519.1 DNA-binding protein [Dehalococcoides mccartyi CG1]APH13131.1 DNA-binding protein [Dehalococcoides mccartyi]QYY58756.1 DNA-binding protein [Dehalococcoides mccartyi]